MRRLFGILNRVRLALKVLRIGKRALYVYSKPVTPKPITRKRRTKK